MFYFTIRRNVVTLYACGDVGISAKLFIETARRYGLQVVLAP